MLKIKALTFDTGGTILDWHGGISAALAGAPASKQTGMRSPTSTGGGH